MNAAVLLAFPPPDALCAKAIWLPVKTSLLKGLEWNNVTSNSAFSALVPEGHSAARRSAKRVWRCNQPYTLSVLCTLHFALCTFS